MYQILLCILTTLALGGFIVAVIKYVLLPDPPFPSPGMIFSGEDRLKRKAK